MGTRDVEILPGVGGRHERVVHAATDLSRLGFHHDVGQPAAIEDAAVCVEHHLVRSAHPTVVPIERVRVLHQELAHAQEPEPRTVFVAVLPLHLVQVHRKVAIGVQLLRHQGRHDLLLRRSEEQVAFVPVAEPEQDLAVEVPAPGLLPRVRGQQDRHPDLLRARGVHLLAHDRLDLAHHAEPQRKRRVHARRYLTHEPGTQEQPM